MRLPQARPNMKVAGETKVAEPEKNGEVAAHNNNKRSQVIHRLSSAGEDLMLSATSAINWDMKQSFVETKVNNKM